MNQTYSAEPEIVKKRLARAGQNTLTLSIPKSWSDDMNLKKGDEITLVKRLEKSAVIFFEKNREEALPRKVLILTEETDDEETIVRKVISAYLAGCNEIVVSTDLFSDVVKPRIATRLQNLARDKLAYSEFTYRSNDPRESAITKAMMQITVTLDYNKGTVKIEDLFYKMCKEIVNLYINVFHAIETYDPRQADIMFKNDVINDKTYLSILRALKEAVVDEVAMQHMGLRSLRECLGYRQIAYNFERISDHSVKIGKAFCNLVRYCDDGTFDAVILNDFKKSREKNEAYWKEISYLSKKALSVFLESLNCLIKRDYIGSDKQIRTVRDKSYGIIVKTRKLLEEIPEMNAKQACMVTQIIESIGRVADYARGSMEVTLNLIFYEALLNAHLSNEFRVIEHPVMTPKKIAIPEIVNIAL